MDYSALIDDCRARFGKPPRFFPFWHWAYLYVMPPLWLHIHRDDALWRCYRDRKRLFSQGQVVWGHLVQANSMLFTPGKSDCPAYFIFSTDTKFDAGPTALQIVARRLYALKETQPDDPELARLAQLVTDEVDRTYLALPDKFAGAKNVACVTVMVARSHLVDGYISSPEPYPMIVNPTETEAVWILPSRYWPASLVQAHRGR